MGFSHDFVDRATACMDKFVDGERFRWFLKSEDVYAVKRHLSAKLDAMELSPEELVVICQNKNSQALYAFYEKALFMVQIKNLIKECEMMMIDEIKTEMAD